MKKRGGGLHLYKTYMFRDKDPIIDVMRTAWEDEGETFAELNRRSNISTTTMRNWFGGVTRRPQFATVAAFVRGCGMEGISFTTDGSPRLLGRKRPPQLRVIIGGKKKRAA